MNNKQLARFYNDLATMLNSGLTIQRGLALMKKGKKDSELWTLDGLDLHISRGGAFWEGMKQYPKHFDAFQVMSVKAGEQSGTLVESCQSLARYFEMRDKERKRLIAGMIYPVVLLHAVVMLPPFKYLLVSNLERSYWSIVLPVLFTAYALVGAGIVAWKTFLHDGHARRWLDRQILRLPYLGKLANGMAMVRVFGALSGLHNAGLPPVMAARESIATAGNKEIEWKLEGALPVLENGGTFTDFFSFSGILSPMQTGALAVAEETGTLTEAMERLVKRLEEETATRLTATIKAIGYLAYIVAAAIVAFTVISFYGGYFKLV